MQAMINGVNGSIIALAVYELAMVIRSEYSGRSETHDIVTMMRRTLPRFISTVCVAMSLEGLIMIIKYSQLDLAGNLVYPVAIIASTALLLAALGVFLKMAPKEVGANGCDESCTTNGAHSNRVRSVARARWLR